jgi:hypothetical protein|tara:strand:+ start:93 stop:248 length:156 start_codon:yes stop_codon:yes gene_type:complete
MVEWVGLVASSFQFGTRLTAVFAEEVGEFSSSPLMAFNLNISPVQRVLSFG